MKRYHLDPLLDSMDEDPEGEWVRYDDANAWWNEVKELPRLQDVATIHQLRASIEEYHKLAESQRESIAYLEHYAAQLRAKLAASPPPEGM